MKAGNSVSIERVRPLLEAKVHEHRTFYSNGKTVVELSGTSTVAELTGISAKTLGCVLNRTQRVWNVSTLDKFLTKMDLEYLSYLPPDQGGFADVYDSMYTPEPKKYVYPYKPAKKSKCRCGGSKDRKSNMCSACERAKRKANKPKCVDCGGEIKGGHRRTKEPRCMSCWKAVRGRTKGNVEYKDNIGKTIKRKGYARNRSEA